MLGRLQVDVCCFGLAEGEGLLSRRRQYTDPD